MSKGSRIVLIRIPLELMTKIEKAIVSANASTKAEPYTISSWFRKCVTDKIEHLLRGSKLRNGSQNGRDQD